MSTVLTCIDKTRTHTQQWICVMEAWMQICAQCIAIQIYTSVNSGGAVYCSHRAVHTSVWVHASTQNTFCFELCTCLYCAHVSCKRAKKKNKRQESRIRLALKFCKRHCRRVHNSFNSARDIADRNCAHVCNVSCRMTCAQFCKRHCRHVCKRRCRHEHNSDIHKCKQRWRSAQFAKSSTHISMSTRIHTEYILQSCAQFIAI